MRQVIVSAFVSVDGVMQAPGGPDEDPTGGFKFGGWSFPYFDETSGQVIGEILSRPYDLLLGRKTYDIFAAYWPYYPEAGPAAGIAHQFNRVTKYVATRSSTPLSWKTSIALHDAAADVARLKREDGPDLLVQGSSVLLQTLLANGLIDRITLFVEPLVLGSGKRFFSDASKPMSLKLESSKTTPSGITINTYVPDGAVRTGSFAIETPSPAELARREKMRREG